MTSISSLRNNRKLPDAARAPLLHIAEKLNGPASYRYKLSSPGFLCAASLSSLSTSLRCAELLPLSTRISSYLSYAVYAVRVSRHRCNIFALSLLGMMTDTSSCGIVVSDLYRFLSCPAHSRQSADARLSLVYSTFARCTTFPACANLCSGKASIKIQYTSS